MPRDDAGRLIVQGKTTRAQIPGTKISVCHGVGGMFTASGTILMSNEPP